METGEPLDHDGPAGAAVVVGARDSDPARVAIACADLAGLIEIGGLGIAGAGIDLGEGFVSARLAGAGGDRRDAVLAALRVLRLGGAWRLGERGATLVALFGVTATKPVGAAAEQAIGEGRWGAVVLASAAAELLGPEQLVRVLALRAPDGVEPVPESAPSVLAANLRRILAPYSRPRRVELVLDLWARVCAGQVAELERERLIASHDLSVLESLRERHRASAEADVLALVRHALNGQLTMLSAVHFRPTWHSLYRYSVERAIQDALAATVLLRAAVAVHEVGVVEGIARVRGEFTAVTALLTRAQARKPVSRAAESAHLAGELPPRPIDYVRQIEARIRQQPRDRAFERFVRARLGAALAYATVVMERCETLLAYEIPHDVVPEEWSSKSVRAWRRAVGYTAVRAPRDWGVEPLVRHRSRPSLAARLAADPTADPVAIERASDLLWLADLADAMARARGHAAARLEPYYRVPRFETNPPRPQPDPLTPRLDSIPLAAAGAAQLLALGASAPDRCRDWAQLCDALVGSGVVASALTGEFEVDDAVLAHDGVPVPGTGVRLQVARSASRLAEWSDYMGNCIAGPWYQDEAARGRSILVGLRDDNDVLVANAELRHSGDGWSVRQLAARFNDEPDPALRQAFHVWVATLRVAEPEIDPVVALPPEPRVRRATPNPVRGVGPVLREAARKAMVDAEPALRELAALAGDADGDPKSLTALRRSSADRLTELCVEALAADPAALPRLWAATGIRPLAVAVEALEPALLARYPRLRTLSDDAALPSKALRALVKDPDIATARSMDLVAHRVRVALGRLAADGDEAFSSALIRYPSSELLCALILVTTCAPAHRVPVTAISAPRATTVPGFPVTALDHPDGPWQAAWPAALELGVEADLHDREFCWERIAERGLLIPAAWVESGGWAALWSRAHTKQP
ncbi:hypothetical protein D7D52_21155 [Nocardia yunnanensis]|uniref:Uncharacterized protein n=1 Tax=Nocardia yunnanensis TaxID=2382165 RepID=A0A386ZFD9_9NOCA|nr:hypothetical protein D7D52_21155 [Nocardia yunnanensis]